MIETEDLTKQFKNVTAVDGISLSVAAGELVALLGPNGAGKSTTLRMLTTLIPPTSGRASVAGFDVVTRQRDVRQRIGYIGQGNGAGHSQRGRDELLSQGRAYGMRVPQARRRADELIDSLGLAEVADRTVSTLSGGQRRRLDIAMGLIHAPELLFLDEPSTGLDPQNRANLQEHIVDLRRTYGTTIVLTTHYLDEADSMAERVIVVDHGRVIADDSPGRLKETHVGDKIILGFDDEFTAARAAAVLAQPLVRHGTRLTVTASGAPRVAPVILDRLRDDGLNVASIEVTRPTLDDVFLTLTGRSLRDGASAEEPEPAASGRGAEDPQRAVPGPGADERELVEA